MNALEIFKNDEFGEIRTIIVENEPYFVGKDVAVALQYSDTSDAIKRHVDEEDKLTRRFTDSGQSRNMYIINESGLYSLILSSKLPNAKKFKRWVTSEVLPSIRKNGGYIANQENLSSEEILARAVLVAQNVIKEKDRVISEQKKEIEYKEDVIVGLVEDIDLTTKRQRITQIVHKSGSNYSDRYAMMYKEFEMKYHMDLSRRLESDTYKNIKPKIKSKMDLIDRGLNMIPQLYEICCKLFENDVKILMQEWENNI